MLTSKRTRHAAMGAAFLSALLIAGCQGTQRVETEVQSHAEIALAAERSNDDALFAVGDTMGVRMTRIPGIEQADAPALVRTTGYAIQAADALGAMTLSGHDASALAKVFDDQE